MKQLITFILIALMATPTFAQYETSRKRSRYNHSDTERYYGLRLGINLSVLNSGDVDYDMNVRPGISLGAVYGMQLANSTPIWLEGGLFYSENGGEQKNPANAEVEKITCRLAYLEVPVVLKYSLDVADDLYVQPFLGGFFALGVGGKTKIYTRDHDKRVSESSFDRINVNSIKTSYAGLNRLDAGLRLGCGIEYQMVYAEMGFDFGLANIGKDEFQSVRTQTLFFNIGVNF